MVRFTRDEAAKLARQANIDKPIAHIRAEAERGEYSTRIHLAKDVEKAVVAELTEAGYSLAVDPQSSAAAGSRTVVYLVGWRP